MNDDSRTIFGGRSTQIPPWVTCWKLMFVGNEFERGVSGKMGKKGSDELVLSGKIGKKGSD